jgi:hypothetical protein
MSDDANQASRREFVKKALYVAPVILTLEVAPSYAKAGSVKPVPRPRNPLVPIIRRILGR